MVEQALENKTNEDSNSENKTEICKILNQKKRKVRKRKKLNKNV